MGVGDLILVVMRWAHGLAAIVWLGGGAYATLVLGPQLRALDDRDLAATVRRGTGREFSRLVDLSTVVFIVSGMVLTFDRLASQGATVAYGVVLALKVALALWMFAIAQRLKERRRPASVRRATRWQMVWSSRLLLWLGAVVVLLAALLKAIYEAGLRS